MSRKESFTWKLAGIKIGARIWENRQYLFLLTLDLALFSSWSVTTGIAPAGDIRAHIFRTLEFAPGLSSGDYTSIQYHGYAFLAGYGVGFYAVTWALFFFFTSFLKPFQAATIACNIMWVLTPLVLAIVAVALADELGMKRANHHRLAQAMLGAIVLLIPGGAIDLSGAGPYLLSFSFSLLALVYGLRTRETKRAVLGLLAFSALSIYTESFGYLFVLSIFLGLIATRRPVLKILPVLAAVCAFSWVQLLEVSGFISSYIEYVTPFGISFLALFGALAIVVCSYSFFVIASRDRIDERHRVILTVVLVTFLAMAAAVGEASFGLNFGALDGVVESVLPWRLLYLNFPVLLFVSIFALGAPLMRFRMVPKILVAFFILLLLASVALRVYPVAFDSLPPASYYEQFSGNRILAADSALTSPASLVTYSAAFNYTTVSGPFSQGDPSFFFLTAYYEWSQYLVANKIVANNFMHLTGANELVTNANGAPQNPSASLGAQSIPYSRAVATTPILLEAANASEALQFALFVNLLGRSGFMLDFVTSAPVNEVYGAVVLPGYEGTTPTSLPVYSLQNDSQSWIDLRLPLVKPFITPPFNLFGPVSNSTVSAASTLAAALITFFHTTYDPVEFAQGTSYYSVSSNFSLPIQLAVSYYPYFSPANYSQNIYHFILLPRPERITWHLPFYEVATAVSLLSIIGVTLVGVSMALISSGKLRARAKSNLC